MNVLKSLTTLLLLFLLALAWTSWDMWRREAKAPAAEETQLREKMEPTKKATPQKKEEVVCAVCGGKKWLEEICRTCKGSGTYVSPIDPNNSQTCVFCAGTGKVKRDCPACSDGVVQQVEAPATRPASHKGAVAPPVAATAKKLLCPTCKGRKFVLAIEGCNSCNGTGTFKNRAAFQDGVACPFCKGSGKVEKVTDTVCPMCQGSGFTMQPAGQ